MLLYHKLNNSGSNICCFSSTRDGGFSQGNYATMNLSPFSGDNPADYAQNKAAACRALGIGHDALIVPFQTHGSAIAIIDEPFLALSEEARRARLDGTDALITQQRDICIGVTTADCVPLFFVDAAKQLVAVAHAGWRGTCARIAQKTIAEMAQRFGSEAKALEVVIGPAISVANYEVGAEVVAEFADKGFDTEQIVVRKAGAYYLDLAKANQLLLEEAGVARANIHQSGICTFAEQERFFSARRLGIKSGRILNGVILK